MFKYSIANIIGPFLIVEKSWITKLSSNFFVIPRPYGSKVECKTKFVESQLFLTTLEKVESLES
jgi:hypothetical protein